MKPIFIFSLYFIVSFYEITLVLGLKKDLDYLLKTHNQIRSSVSACKIAGQPKARGLKKLIWDGQLALKAAALSNTCYFRFSNVTTPKFKYVGQNIAAYASVEIAMNEWFQEYQDYDFKRNTCKSSCGNYIQIVWQETTHIGCGVTYCPKTKRFPYGVFVVCNYGPGAKFDKSPYDVISYVKCPTVQSKWQQTRLNGKNCFCYK
ncbi:unnamed protein product [Schistosoma turkestanicum]|nr:unnamed protein product [Schistosoma turkestanicum]